MKLEKINDSDRDKANYTWNYRFKNADNTYVNIVQNTTPLAFDNTGKPIIGLAHYTVLHQDIVMDISASAKLLNVNNEYEMKSAIDLLKNNAEIRKNISKNGLDTIKYKYTIEAYKKNLFSLLTDVLK